MWILTAQNPAVVPVYNRIHMERRLNREAHVAKDASILSSMSTAKFLRATWSLGFSA
jgi:hypothetical protein